MSAAKLNQLIVRREWFGHWIYPLLFCLSLLVSLSAYLTLDSLQKAVDSYIVDNQKAMVGGDLIVTARQPFDGELNQWLSNLPKENIVNDRQFNAMTYAGEASLLVRVKAVDVTYPCLLYTSPSPRDA